ncbi:hypothetical protein OIDMADRAFT_59120 [Oidiodendron maius Zn]|uniref:Uncharacterized protein n=1 Tax=Oidiodendron maius (strain Zn) TaxID=913774 RepID=A0A0C3GXS0_OIDMZ|nr:hypothetical protein OIDMADRAFT_59120 [Oidiodendron maius Zn]
MPKSQSSSFLSSSSSSSLWTLVPQTGISHDTHRHSLNVPSHLSPSEQVTPATKDLTRHYEEYSALMLWIYGDPEADPSPRCQWPLTGFSLADRMRRMGKIIEEFDSSILPERLWAFPLRKNRVDGENHPYRLCSGEDATQPLRKNRTTHQANIKNEPNLNPGRHAGSDPHQIRSYGIPSTIPTNESDEEARPSTQLTPSQTTEHSLQPIAPPSSTSLLAREPAEDFAVTMRPFMAQSLNNDFVSSNASSSSMSLSYNNRIDAVKGNFNGSISQYQSSSSQQHGRPVDPNFGLYNGQIPAPAANLLTVESFIRTANLYSQLAVPYQNAVSSSPPTSFHELVHGGSNYSPGPGQSQFPEIFEGISDPQLILSQADSEKQYIDPRILYNLGPSSTQPPTSEHSSSNLPRLEFTPSSPGSRWPHHDGAITLSQDEFYWHQTESLDLEPADAYTVHELGLTHDMSDNEESLKDKGKGKVPVNLDEK